MTRVTICGGRAVGKVWAMKRHAAMLRALGVNVVEVNRETFAADRASLKGTMDALRRISDRVREYWGWTDEA